MSTHETNLVGAFDSFWNKLFPSELDDGIVIHTELALDLVHFFLILGDLSPDTLVPECELSVSEDLFPFRIHIPPGVAWMPRRQSESRTCHRQLVVLMSMKRSNCCSSRTASWSGKVC